MSFEFILPASIWSWIKHWIDHWISSHHNKQNLAVVVAAAAGKILRGTLKSRHVENFQECHLALMWEFLNYPGSINRSQILSRAVRPSHTGNYLSMSLLFNVFHLMSILFCSEYWEHWGQAEKRMPPLFGEKSLLFWLLAGHTLLSIFKDYICRNKAHLLSHVTKTTLGNHCLETEICIEFVNWTLIQNVSQWQSESSHI